MEQNDPYVGRDVLGGRYAVRACLGGGGMGVVYRADEPDEDRVVALKILRPEWNRRKDVVARFRREARTLATLTHPRITRVFRHGQLEDGACFIAMELLTGRSLADLVERDGAVPIDRAVAIVRQVCDALAEAHGRGIVHRDLKPENIFLVETSGGEDSVKVLDFGLARVTAQERRPGSVELTREGVALGTPEFMSPEQARGLPVDHRTDLYALGVVLFELVTGALPWDLAGARTTVEVFTRQLLQPPRSLRDAAPTRDLPAWLQACVDRCLAREPADRFADAATLARALDAR